MQTSVLIQELSEAFDFKRSLDSLKTNRKQLIYGLNSVQKNIYLALINNREKKNMLIACENEKVAKEVWQDLDDLVKDYEVLYFPSLEIIPFEVLAQSSEVEGQRLEVLASLLEEKPVLVVAPIAALTKSLIKPEYFQEALRTIDLDSRIDMEELKTYLVKYGYEQVEKVEIAGQFSLRGGILDVFSILYENPVRMELFDDEIDSLRFFSVASQRSLENIQEFKLFPAKEIFFLDEVKKKGLERIEKDYELQREKLAKRKDRDALERLNLKTQEVLEKVENNLYFPGIEKYQNYFYEESFLLMDYFSEGSIFAIYDPLRVEESLDLLEKERAVGFSQLLLRGSVLARQKDFYLEKAELLKSLEDKRLVYLSLLPHGKNIADFKEAKHLEVKEVAPFFGKLDLLREELLGYQKKDYKILILVNSLRKAERIKEALFDMKLVASILENPKHLEKGQIIISLGNLSQGSEFLESKILVLTEREIFNQKKRKSKRRMFQKQGQEIKRIDELAIGDYVVHNAHGIGRYLGVEKLEISDISKDYLVIKYSGEDKLYVLADQVSSLQKYIADEKKKPRLHKLGGTEWQKTKLKVQESVEELAEGLLELYAKRQSQPGFQFDSDDAFQEEFEEAFIYQETEDQMKAILDVKKDMEKSVPMDRLICGDVGYGKTEVAIRAAFKAVNSGKQVAVLVPTTVLAQQHYNTFVERFKNFPIKIEVLSRFKSKKEEKEILEKTKRQKIDILIGTHKLLSKGVKFFDLGLLVVDEEQRFGVKHKEKIKEIKENVDVLTLSATPIPRTLHMSLVGIRDLSIIETPPEDRYPIQTYVVEHSEALIEDAIRRELARAGQIYYVHNRVDSIEKTAEKIKELVPEARIGIAHGRLSENQLEAVMFDFIEHEIDILLCTTIIETGLDVSNVNTMIVENADKMGLSQLYQLRGRIGRSNRVAYAYLTYKKDKMLTEIAEKRLHAIQEYTELGSGFKIAMRDLEIRGAGNLLGKEQHGHVASVGFDLYCQLLEGAVKELKGEKKKEEVNVEIDLDISSYIPDTYIKDSGSKLDFYQRISLVETPEEIFELEDELLDRFGDLPDESYNLLHIAKLKVLAKRLYIMEIKQKQDFVHLSFFQDPGLEGEDLMKISQAFQRKVSFSFAKGFIVKVNIRKVEKRELLEYLLEIIDYFSKFVQK